MKEHKLILDLDTSLTSRRVYDLANALSSFAEELDFNEEYSIFGALKKITFRDIIVDKKTITSILFVDEEGTTCYWSEYYQEVSLRDLDQEDL